MPQARSVLWTESPLLEAGSPVVEAASRQLKGKLSALLEHKGRGIYAEFDQLKAIPIQASQREATGRGLHTKNRQDHAITLLSPCRYSNVLPFDYNRVRLGINESGPYINASLLESASGGYCL